jgi:hypothetical protein
MISQNRVWTFGHPVYHALLNKEQCKVRRIAQNTSQVPALKTQTLHTPTPNDNPYDSPLHPFAKVKYEKGKNPPSPLIATTLK